MPDTLPNVPLPPNLWVNLYDATGIPVGSEILVQNVGVCDIFLSSQATTPTTYLNHQILKRSQFVVNDQGDVGAWAFCLAGGSVNVRLD